MRVTLGLAGGGGGVSAMQVPSGGSTQPVSTGCSQAVAGDMPAAGLPVVGGPLRLQPVAQAI